MKFSRTVLPIILLCLLISGIVLHSINNPMKERRMKEAHYKGLTTAKVLSVETVRKLHFYHVGNEYLIDSYIVNYRFKVGDKIYTGTDKIFNNKNFRNLISNLLSEGEIITQFEVADPSKNILKR